MERVTIPSIAYIATQVRLESFGTVRSLTFLLSGA